MPAMAILNSGAFSILIGRDFAGAIPRLQLDQLTPAPRVITACGTHATPLGMSKSLLQFRIAVKTSNETTIMGRVVVMDTTEYDVLLGMQFLGAREGFVDPVTEQFC